MGENLRFLSQFVVPDNKENIRLAIQKSIGLGSSACTLSILKLNYIWWIKTLTFAVKSKWAYVLVRNCLLWHLKIIITDKVMLHITGLAGQTTWGWLGIPIDREICNRQRVMTCTMALERPVGHDGPSLAMSSFNIRNNPWWRVHLILHLYIR